MSTWPERLTSVLCGTRGWGFAPSLALAIAVFAAPAMAQPPYPANYPAHYATKYATNYPHIGRAATPQELAAWDTDVRPDFKGLPRGAGSVAQGQVVWEAQCASCHGVFGESNVVFAPLVGGTTAADIKTGHVARLNDPAFPGRTTLMKLSSVSTLWDYIQRAMPWNQPRSLSTEQVYAVTAYLLNLGGVLPDNFVLSDNNIGDVQKLLPNRNGLTTQHGLWPGRGIGAQGKPDVKAVACMKNCAPAPRVSSFLPDFARNQHGNLALQQRSVGPQRGLGTDNALANSLANSLPSASANAPANTQANALAIAPAIAPENAPANAPVNARAHAGTASRPAHVAALALAQKHSCTACHGLDRAIVGPGLREVAARYAQRAVAANYLAGKIKAGGQGVWGAIPMPPQSLSEEDTMALAHWLAVGAPDE